MNERQHSNNHPCTNHESMNLSPSKILLSLNPFPSAIAYVLSIPNEPRIPGQVKNRAALLKLMNSPGFDKHAYYHFQNDELIEKSGDPMLSEETKRSLIGRDGGPIYTWGVRLSTYLSGLSSNLPSLADVGSGFRNNCAVELSLTPPYELFGYLLPRCVFIGWMLMWVSRFLV